MTVQFCPKCGAMQGNWERCQVCGAELPGIQPAKTQPDGPLGALPPDRSAVISIALYVLIVIVGIILIGALCVLLLQLVL